MKLLKGILVLVMAAASSLSLAGGVVIVHPSNHDKIDRELVAKIFLGKTKAFPTKGAAVPISLKGDLDVRDMFYDKVLDKNPSQFNSYWSRMVFSGSGMPPKEVESTDVMLQLIRTNPNMIGFINADKVTPDVRVVLQF